MRKLLILVSFFNSFLLISEVPIPGVSSEGVFFETIESSGKVDWSFTEGKETLSFGKTDPAYGIGLLFAAKNLPNQFLKSNGGNSLIQISFGNRNPSPNQLAQFGSLSIRTSSIPLKQSIELSFQNLDKKDSGKNPSAFLIFNSIQTSRTSSESEKLKGTYFSDKGTLKLTPKGEPKKVSFKVEGRSLQFRTQQISLALDVKLGTPFSNEKTDLKGAIDIPLYWPAESQADIWIQKLAKNSLETFPEISPQDRPQRSLASPKKRDD